MKPTIFLFCLTLASLSHGESAGPLQPVLQSIVDKHIAPGVVVLVANKDKVLDLEAAGYASLANKLPMRKDAVFWIASMSKSLTGAALMMLVDEGKVSLDDPVDKFLPEFKGQQVKDADGILHAPKHPITVREVMCHTSGLVLANEKGLKKTQSLQENVALFASYPLRQEPGTKYEYNNCGIDTGGRIIEVLSGMRYADFMQKRLFDPLGMKDTTFWPNEEQASRLAHTARFTADKTGLEEIGECLLVQIPVEERLAQLGQHRLGRDGRGRSGRRPRGGVPRATARADRCGLTCRARWPEPWRHRATTASPPWPLRRRPSAAPASTWPRRESPWRRKPSPWPMKRPGSARANPSPAAPSPVPARSRSEAGAAVSAWPTRRPESVRAGPSRAAPPPSPARWMSAVAACGSTP